MKRYHVRRVRNGKVVESNYTSLKEAKKPLHIYKFTEFKAVPQFKGLSDERKPLFEPLPQRMITCWIGFASDFGKIPSVVIYLVEDPMKAKPKRGTLTFGDAQRILRNVMQRDAAMLGPTPAEGSITTLVAEGKAVAIHWQPIPGGSSQKRPHLVTLPIEMVYALMDAP